ncbi:PAS domain S-box-containing protein/diguanylate cyclase (GGDEF) domain-containing protein [Virgibacillus subterraneus]|uniref:PAS domain S-box-containing protein/diguanylate cyclase (GGDEF) domain-containing protein n=1 Tax=Virgibacillus subterraneus TaxID=621109 RepID=A0A1H9AUX4_9BACI|nr:EAL domain-containing protein [Virgibacillus subterraneus]SEP80584.1 PAS domain S-box-containing protein/diguanylate cyclase (GGDEF) domain-containing protein [Virgibacillus subterraneus]
MLNQEDNFITRSKQLCEESGMDPNVMSRPKVFLTENELAEKRKSYSEILSVVSFFSNKLLNSLEGTPILVVISDANGYLLDIDGDESIKATTEQFGIILGSQFTQEDTGTNVVSLTLQQKHPISLIGEDHYHKSLQNIACYGDTFQYTDEKNLLGSVSIMMPIQFQNPLFLTMLSQAVDSIERELLLRKQNRKLDIMNQIMLSRTSNGIVITDENGITTEFNDFAQQISNNSKDSVIGKNIYESQLTGDYFKKVLEQEKTFKNEVIKFTNQQGERTVCLFDAQPIYEEGKMVGAFGQFRDISVRYSLQEKYNYLAYHDDLTNLANRRYIKKEVETLIDEIKSGYQRNLAILFLDLDRFKIINDNFGHSNGDILLTEVSKRLSKCLGANDLLARMGGDEFIFLLKDFEDFSYVTEKAGEILAQFNEPFQVAANELHTTASIGIAIYPDYPITPEQLMVYADNAMYQAKSQGKNRYAVYTSELLVDSVEELQLEADLRKALDQNEFVLHYQPQINNKTGKIVGLEALIRWQHPKLGLLYPGKFIKLAEDSGLITQIGEWVIKEACTQNKKWQEDGWEPIKIAVNLSTQQFLTQDLVKFMESVLNEAGLDPKYLVVEITEYMAMEYDYSLKVLQQLKALGICISIDDFGTGYSSLKYLKDFPVDYIKIDKSFVGEIIEDNNDAVIVKAIITLAHNLSMEVIAEGVETKAQLEFLQQYHCDKTQGYFFSKAISAEEFEQDYHTLQKQIKSKNERIIDK